MEKSPDVLIINSYAGSLVIAATALKLNVLASLEDKGYAIETQKLNFPRLTYLPTAPWPDPGLSIRDAIAIAHPPCACFSVQALGQAQTMKMGMDSPHFKSTRLAVEYALEQRVRALAVESVKGTLEGARSYHEKVARDNGYFLFRILQNAITFGLPQWRERFWAIYVRADCRQDGKLYLDHKTTIKSVEECFKKVSWEKPPSEWNLKIFDKVHGLIRKRFSRGETEEILMTPGSLPVTLNKKLGRKTASITNTAEEFGMSRFSSAWFKVLSPRGFAGALLCMSHWIYQGRPVGLDGYNAIMGYPYKYRFHNPKDHRCLLSRGVCPPVAKWVLEQVIKNVSEERPAINGFVDKIATLNDGEIADFRIKRAELKQRGLFDKSEGDGDNDE